MDNERSRDPANSGASGRQQAVLRAYIKSNELLGKLSSEHQERLAIGSRLRQMDEGQFVFNQGTEGNHFYALCRGSVKVYRTSPDGRDAVVKILGPGEIFGEVILFRPIPYPANALCLAETALIEIDRSRLLAMLEESGFRLDFIAVLMEKLQYLNQRVYMLGALDVEERFFLHIISNYGILDEYELDLSKKDLASAIGTVPETLSRLLNRLKARGTIAWEGNRFSIDRATTEYFAQDLRQAGFRDL
jgi:CRP/FNR family transcriptional regulator